jgi:glycosyltransferase involved in cell wall biosynthesis
MDHYVNLVDRFHVLSKHSGSVLEGYGIPAARIHVVPLTLPLEYRRNAEPAPSRDPNLVLFAGWLNERKGLHSLLEAMPHVLRECPSAHLVAIGGKVRFGEEYENKLQAIIDKHQFRSRVTFTGHLQPSEVKQYLEKAAVVVIPEQYENMSPLLMIEAMSMAKPLVISRVGGVPEYVEHGVNGWMADPLDPLDFARNIVIVLKDASLAARAGERARATILAKCNDDTIWEKTRLMYESL